MVGVGPSGTYSALARVTLINWDGLGVLDKFVQQEYQVTDYLTLTPGVIWINAPDNNNDNQDLVIGTLRTTFSF